MGYELQCTEIAETAAAAIARSQRMIPGLSEVGTMSRSSGYAHAGVHLTMQDGSQYVVDWWATLDVTNPLVFKAKDFDEDRKSAAIPFKQFTGFR
jgi:hypothetical protein